MLGHEAFEKDNSAYDAGYVLNMPGHDMYMFSCYENMQHYEPYMQDDENEPNYKVLSEAHACKSETVLNRYRNAEVEATHEGSVLQSTCVNRLSESSWSQHKRQAYVARSLLRDRSKGESEVMLYRDECCYDLLQFTLQYNAVSLYCLLHCLVLATTVSCPLRLETATRPRCSRAPGSVAHVLGGV